MIHIVLLFSLLVSFYRVAQAEPEKLHGYDALGLARYCEVYLQAPALPALSTLLTTFGDPLPCVAERARRGGLKLVQVDIRDATCFRNKVCPAGTPSLTDWGFMRTQVRKIANLAVEFPGLTWQISPFLEHDFRSAAVIRTACGIVAEECPTCECVNSPASGARRTEFQLEEHGTKKPGALVSHDGASVFDADNFGTIPNVPRATDLGSRVTFVWWPELNLRCTGEQRFVMPQQRTGAPTLNQFRQAYLLTKPVEPVSSPPSFCKTVREVDAKKGEEWKPNAKAYCNSTTKDRRGNRPVLLLRAKGRARTVLSVYSADGRRVGCLRSFGSEPNGVQRYYSGACSKQTADELSAALGSEWGYVKTGVGQCVRINAIRRMGKFYGSGRI